MTSLLDDFLSESRELIRQANDDLLGLERDPTDGPLLQQLFRAVHTVKGTSGFFELPALTGVLHAAEDVLDAVRSGGAAVTHEMVDQLLATGDLVGRWLEELTNVGRMSAPEDGQALASSLRGLLTTPALVGPAAVSTDKPTRLAAVPWLDDVPEARLHAVAAAARECGATVTAITYRPDDLSLYMAEDPLARAIAVPRCQWREAVPLEPWPAGEPWDPLVCRLEFHLLSLAPREEIESVFVFKLNTEARLTTLAPEALSPGAQCLVPATVVAEPEVREPAEAPETSAKSGRESTLRVEASRIDALMELVGELVVTRNSVPYLAHRAETTYHEPALAREIRGHHAVLSHITQSLEHAVMRVRLVPVSQAFQRFARLVRDLARKLDKSIAVVMVGQDTEADKNVVDDLVDALTHLVRNSADHGIESPAERLAAGKPAEGTITLSAAYCDEQMVVEVRDDGHGVDADKVRLKAVAKGMLTDEQAAAMDDEAALQFVFAPGFSTADAISDVSGRGVGMDVVVHLAQAAGGTVRIMSEAGKGTTVRLAIPRAMTVTRVTRLMTVVVAGEVYGVPFDRITETVRVPRAGVQMLGDEPFVCLRERLIPLCHLAERLELAPASELAQADEVSLMLITIGQREVGLVVDRFHEVIDAIVRPPAGVLVAFPLYAGTALLGDGRVLLVLDLEELVPCQ